MEANSSSFGSIIRRLKGSERPVLFGTEVDTQGQSRIKRLVWAVRSLDTTNKNRRYPGVNAICWDAFCYDSSGPDYRTLSNGNSWQNGRVTPD